MYIYQFSQTWDIACAPSYSGSKHNGFAIVFAWSARLHVVTVRLEKWSWNGRQLLMRDVIKCYVLHQARLFAHVDNNLGLKFAATSGPQVATDRFLYFCAQALFLFTDNSTLCAYDCICVIGKQSFAGA